MTGIENLDLRLDAMLAHALCRSNTPIGWIHKHPIAKIHRADIQRTNLGFQRNRLKPFFNNIFPFNIPPARRQINGNIASLPNPIHDLFEKLDPRTHNTRLGIAHMDMRNRRARLMAFNCRVCNLLWRIRHSRIHILRRTRSHNRH